MCSRVKLNVSGTLFEFNREILLTKPCGKLAEMVNCYELTDKPVELIVDRSPGCFDAILNYYQTGKLHIPMTMCPGSFQEELNFWRIDVDELTDCCMFR